MKQLFIACSAGKRLPTVWKDIIQPYIHNSINILSKHDDTHFDERPVPQCWWEAACSFLNQINWFTEKITTKRIICSWLWEHYFSQLSMRGRALSADFYWTVMHKAQSSYSFKWNFLVISSWCFCVILKLHSFNFSSF